MCIKSNDCNCNVTVVTDRSYQLTHEDTEALLSLHDTFEKCVVSSIFLVSALLALALKLRLILMYSYALQALLLGSGMNYDC